MHCGNVRPQLLQSLLEAGIGTGGTCPVGCREDEPTMSMLIIPPSQASPIPRRFREDFSQLIKKELLCIIPGLLIREPFREEQMTRKSRSNGSEMPKQLLIIQPSCTKCQGQLRDKLLRPIAATKSKLAAATTRASADQRDRYLHPRLILSSAHINFVPLSRRCR